MGRLFASSPSRQYQSYPEITTLALVSTMEEPSNGLLPQYVTLLLRFLLFARGSIATTAFDLARIPKCIRQYYVLCAIWG